MKQKQKPATKTADKHTPGEWKVDDLSMRLRGEDLSIYSNTTQHKNPHYIARVYGAGVIARGEDIDTERNANARLIAAAPDLLAACKAGIEAIRSVQNGDIISGYLEKLQAAIARAEAH